MVSNFRSARVGQSIKWSFLVACAVVLVLAPGAGAYPLGGTTAISNNQTVLITVATPPLGTLISGTPETETWTFTTTAGTTSGTLTTAVAREADGTLDFYYQVHNDSTSATSIARESNTFFAAQFMTSVGIITDGSTIGGGFVDGTVVPDFADKKNTGVIGFFANSTANVITPGSTSVVYVVSTSATNFVLGNAEMLDGGSVTVSAYQPGSTIPEPATMALLGGGLLALAGIRRYRH